MEYPTINILASVPIPICETSERIINAKNIIFTKSCAVPKLIPNLFESPRLSSEQASVPNCTMLSSESEKPIMTDEIRTIAIRFAKKLFLNIKLN